MYLTEYSVPPDQPIDENERQMQPFQHPLDWDADTATQHDDVPLVHPSMHFYPNPGNDNHPNTNNSSQRAPQRPTESSPRPGTPGSSHCTSPSGDCRTQQDAGANATGSPAPLVQPHRSPHPACPGPSRLPPARAETPLYLSISKSIQQDKPAARAQLSCEDPPLEQATKVDRQSQARPA